MLAVKTGLAASTAWADLMRKTPLLLYVFVMLNNCLFVILLQKKEGDSIKLQKRTSADPVQHFGVFFQIKMYTIESN